MKKILAISGSIKQNSTNNRILEVIKEMYATKAEVKIYENLDTLPFLNPDLDNDLPPAEVTRFREAIKAADAVVICTPEYVFSLPGVLKNALEWMVSSSTFSGKPVALITAAASGQKAQESLHLIMKTIEAQFNDDMTLLIQGAKGKITNAEAELKIQLQKVMGALLSEIRE
jgi:chromate reductase, NAD(P)H dehydrogenase (quinone)